MLVIRLSVCAVVVGFCSWSAHAGLVVDGHLGDWGVTAADNNASDFTTWSPGIDLLGYHHEDQDDLAGRNFFLDPHYGGQDFDGEMMAVAAQGDRLYIALATGQRPDNGFKFYQPGDIRIETSLGTYGIEVGGGKGGDPGPAISSGAPGSTYQLNSLGEVNTYVPASTLQVAGSIWTDVNWILNSLVPYGPTQLEIHDDSLYVGLAEFISTRDSVTAQHSIIELAFDLRLLDGAMIHSVHWRPACGNDELDVLVNAVPEPGTLAFLALGGLAVLRRRR